MRVSRPVELTPDVLATLAPPEPEHDATKHDRGTVVVVGGSLETPGAILLAGIAALRAGAGRLRLVTDPSCTAALAIAVPEARVTTFEQDLDGDAVLVGPGMPDDDEIVDRATSGGVPVVLDAGALAVAARHPGWIRRLGGRALLIPNPSELELLGAKDAPSAAKKFGATVAVRGAETWIATSDGDVYVDRRGTPGLATSGSGDVAAGLAAGFLTRGATPAGAAAWMAAAHGRAGERLGGSGFLARELLDELRAAIADLTSGA